MTTGQKIYECRRKRGMTQEELADHLGITRQSVSKWESDGAFPETEKILELCKLFGLSADELLFGETERKEQPETSEEYFNETAESFGYADKEPKEEERPLWGLVRHGNLHYEYVSKARLWGLPVLHVNFGLGAYRAKGIIAIGNIATGFISFGMISIGLLAYGMLALGLLAFGALVLGGISFGGVAFGVLVFGGVAIGVFSIGGLSVGWLAFGGFARGYYAFGDWANGWFAAGESHAAGQHAFSVAEQFEALCAWADTTLSSGWADFVKWLASSLRSS